MVMMLNVHGFNIAHPERLGHLSICPKYVYDVDFDSVVDVAPTKHKNFPKSLSRRFPVVAVSLVRLQAKCRLTDSY